jgi:hypothetical protein
MKRLVGMCLLSLAFNANANIYGFDGVNLQNADIASQLSVDVTGFTTSPVTYLYFKNASNIASSITGIFR